MLPLVLGDDLGELEQLGIELGHVGGLAVERGLDLLEEQGEVEDLRVLLRRLGGGRQPGQPSRQRPTGEQRPAGDERTREKAIPGSGIAERIEPGDACHSDPLLPDAKRYSHRGPFRFGPDFARASGEPQ